MTHKRRRPSKSTSRNNHQSSPVATPKAWDNDGKEIRLQVVLARAGIGSRRACEELISRGKVRVDGKVIRTQGVRVDPFAQDIRVNDSRIRLERRVYYAVCKPRGMLCTNDDPSGRPLAIEIVPKSRERLFCVGRLDEDSEGLLLITNDGELTNLLTHPSHGVSKCYRATVSGSVTRDQVDELRKDMWFSDGKVNGAYTVISKKGTHRTELEMTISEGQNRQIRRMIARVGLALKRLQRIRIGPINLGNLKAGRFRVLREEEVEALRKDGTSGHTSAKKPRKKPNVRKLQSDNNRDKKPALKKADPRNNKKGNKPSVDKKKTESPKANRRKIDY